MKRQVKLFPVKKNFWDYSLEKQVCNTCKKEIGFEISRIVIMRNIDRGPCLFFFHFFFPCWDFKTLCQKYPRLIINKAGFSVPQELMIKDTSMKDLEKKFELWT